MEEEKRGYLIDSDVLIQCLRGDLKKIELLRSLRQEGCLFISAVVLFEIEAGMRQGEEEKTSLLLDSLACREIDRVIAKSAASLVRGLQRKGQRLLIGDALIAATCLGAQLILVTDNVRHYRQIPGLKILKSGVINGSLS